MTQAELAKIVGLKESSIRIYEHLTAAAAPVQSFVETGKLDASTAYEISTIKDEERQIRQVIAKHSNYFWGENQNNST